VSVDAEAGARIHRPARWAVHRVEHFAGFTTRVTWELPDGRGLKVCFGFMVPYIESKKAWPYPPDVEYFNDLPVRQPDLLFAGLAYRKPGYISVWQRLKDDPTVPEIIRNHPLRQPLLWIEPQPLY